MAVKVITPPVNVLSLATLRMHLRLIGDPHPEDSWLQSALAAAVNLAQHYTGRGIGSQTLELALDEFPDSPIQLKFTPVTSIISIKYLDLIGVEQTILPTTYVLDDYGIQHWAVPVSVWPVTGYFANAVKIRYVTGDIPPQVQAALLLTVADMYDNREQANLSKGAMTLLDTIKSYS